MQQVGAERIGKLALLEESIVAARGPALARAFTMIDVGLSEAAPLVAIINGQVFRCLVCQGGLFTTRAIKLNTAAFELLDLAWANCSSLGVICHHCGYIHEFLGEAVQLFDQETGACVS